MPTTAWTGAVDGDWSDSGNWSNGIPANNDTVIIASSAVSIDTSYPTGGAGVLTGITLQVGRGYTGTIATEAAPLELDGPVFDFDSGGNAAYVTGAWTLVQVHGGTAGDDTLKFDASSDTAITTLSVLGGNGTITVGANATCAACKVLGAPGATVVIAASVTNATLEVSSGDVTTSSTASTSMEARGGELTVSGSAATAALTGNGGTVNWNTSGRPTTLNWNDGFLNGLDNGNATVTAPTTFNMNGGTVDLRNGLPTFDTWTWTYNGGIVYPPVGSTVTVS